jgi:hypothetical protein
MLAPQVNAIARDLGSVRRNLSSKLERLTASCTKAIAIA